MTSPESAALNLDDARLLLSDYLQDRVTQVAAIDQRLVPLVTALADFTGQGKWLRPQFLLAGFRVAADGPIPADISAAAGGLELLQSCALIHDDIIDRSETRRGAPSTHRSLAAAHRRDGLTGDADHHGVSVAILLGDLALAWADDLVAHSVRTTGQPAAAQVWREVRTEVLAGQLLDLTVAAWDETDPAQQYQDAMAVNRAKTAAYTVRRPVELGAALGGADLTTRQALAQYGTSLGIAFQLRDDLLGLFGDPAVTGKPAGDDLVEGKRTAVLALVRTELAATGRLSDFDRRMAGPLAADDVAALLDVIAATTAPAAIELEINRRGAEALAALEPLRLTVPGERLAPLVDLADRALHRNR